MTPSTCKVLVTYEGRLGSTAEIATFIGEVIAKRGASVDVKSVYEADNPSAYDLVIVGSAIRYDRWLPGAVDFVRSHEEALAKRPVAYFLTCLTLARITLETMAKAGTYADQIRSLTPDVQPVSIGRFGGVLNIKRAPWITGLFLRFLSALTGVKEGDYRDWDAIREWSISLLSTKVSGYDAANVRF